MLITRKNFDFWKAHPIRPYISYKCPSHTAGLVQRKRQGHTLMDDHAVKMFSQKEWMPLSKGPPLERWLQPEMDDDTKNRLRLAGNVVIPQMAYLAANALGKLAKITPESYEF